MMVTDWNGKKAVILGLARQGSALARYLAERGARVTVSDLRPADQLSGRLEELGDLPIRYVLGEHPLSLLDNTDMVFLSGGVPLEAPLPRAARERGIPLSNDSQLFLQACPALVIAITGSAGKTTTTALTGEMCRASGRRTWVGGNIGRSMLPDLDKIEVSDLVVMELSSFQLELMSCSTPLAAILNLTPNHLDRHKTMEVYTAAKARVLDYQPANSIAVLGQDDPGAWALRDRVHGRLRSFGLQGTVEDGALVCNGRVIVRGPEGERDICAMADIQLPGQHNLLNALAAATLADSAGIPATAIGSAARQFTGVVHRLELVRELRDVRWYDDSIATAPERMLAALRSFDEPLLLLAGGRDKDLPWEEAADFIQQRVRVAILFGEAADLIARHLERAARRVSKRRLEKVVLAGALPEAVKKAAQLARPGEVVLLSPGGTSFDAYPDFAVRGEHFKELVRAL